MTIAICGLGIIGQAWAEILREDNLEVRAWNRTFKHVAGAVQSIDEAVSGAAFIFLVVSDPAAVENVLRQALPHLKPGQTLIQSSTVGPSDSRRFAALVDETGARFLEAPFTGSKPAALARQVVFYLGGDADLIEHARPVLERLARALLPIGEVGSASALKLAMNLQIAGIAWAMSEGLALSRAAGLEDETFFEALELNVARSGLVDLKRLKLQERDFAPQFSLKHMNKDLRLALDEAQNDGVELPQTANLRALYQRGIDEGWGEDDFIGLVRLLEEK